MKKPFHGLYDARGQLVNSERVIREKLERFNPTAGLTPEMLSQFLLAWSRGEIRHLAWLMEWLEQHDDMILSVAGKAKKAVSRHGWEISDLPDLSKQERSRAEKQRQVLSRFFRNVECRHAVEHHEVGGIRLLIEQVMDGYGKGHSVHHLIWKPSASGLNLQTVFVPLWFFESTEGDLRYLQSSWDQKGASLDTLGGESAWMISRGRGIMQACAIAWMFKNIPRQDWLTYCDRHGMPAFLGKTNQEKGSAGWNALLEAVGSIGAEYGAVVNTGDSIEVLDLTASGNLPFPELMDRMDRAIAILWRGGDLGTVSRENAVGATPQDEATEDLDADNALWVSETIDRQLSQRVLDWHFGAGTPKLVEFSLRTKTRENVERDLNVVNTAVSLGLRVSKVWFCEKFGVTEADEKETEVLKASSSEMSAANAQSDVSEPDLQRLVQASISRAIGIRSQMLEPVRGLIAELAEKVERDALSDQDLLDFLEAAADAMPSFFSPELALDLALELEKTLGTAAVAGAIQSL